MNGWSKTVGVAALLAVASACGWGQYPASGVPAGTLTGRQPGSFGSDPDPISTQKRMRALNADRHKSMVSDTDKLLKLARQLDQEIASNPTDELTPEELQKLAAIEKLAHNVKTKMAQSFAAGPEFRPPLVPIRGPGED